MSESEVICERRGAIGLIRLNRVQALNALTLGMVRGIAAALDLWENDSDVHAVVIKGAGDKAFCAGGDIRLLYEQGRAGNHAAQLQFYGEEYRLNARINRYPKPYIATLDGIVMGGGVGVSVLGSHRIASEKFLFAMPEVGIGFFPDVGATYFLPRLPGAYGRYLALTGARIKAGDALALGLVQSFVPSAAMPGLIAALAEGGDADATIARFSTAGPQAPLLASGPEIERCFSGESVKEIMTALGRGNSEFALATRAMMETKSPTSMAVALRQMQIGAALSIERAMQVEYRIVSRICHGVDFYEGVRAVIIDKDQAPRWSPPAGTYVDESHVDAIFAPLGDDDLVIAPPLPAQ